MATELAIERPARRRPALDSAELGLALFVLTEVMFFAGLVSAFLVLRAGSALPWPPPGQPRLPVEITGLNTLALLGSGVAYELALRALRGRRTAWHRWMGATVLLAGLFLAVQGIEWVRLIGFGLTLNSSVYGGTFYLLVGAHALHLIAALIALLVVWLRSADALTVPERGRAVRLCRVYWWFVVAVWPALYLAVYF